MALTDYNIPDVVMTLLPASMTGSVTAGLPVELTVASAPSTQYGYLEGSILEVSNTPLTTDDIGAILGLQPEVVALALGSEPGILAVVGLTPIRPPRPVTPGPLGRASLAIVNGTPATAKVILSRQPPIDVIFPGLAESLGT